MKRILASLAVLAMLASPVLAKTDSTMQYGDKPYNTGVADGALPATASPLPLIALIGVGTVMLGMMAIRKGKNRR